MKKILLIVVNIVFAITSINAQEEVPTYGFEFDNFFLEGNIGFNINNTSETDNTGDVFENDVTAFNINPKVGFFIEDKFAIGIELIYENSNTTNTDFSVTPSVSTEVKENSIGGGVFARYYFLELGKRFKTYTELGVGFESSTEETFRKEVVEPVVDKEAKNINAGLGIGINYFISDSFAINFALTDLLSFNTGTAKDNSSPTEAETKTTNFRGNFNIFNNFFNTAQFGLTYKL